MLSIHGFNNPQEPEKWDLITTRSPVWSYRQLHSLIETEMRSTEYDHCSFFEINNQKTFHSCRKSGLTPFQKKSTLMADTGEVQISNHP